MPGERCGRVKKRIVSIELLRIIAMMMVVLLHYLSKGELLEPLTGPLSAQGFSAWLLESFAIVAVNVYMLISGYFLVESGFRLSRLVRLICQVLFYSLGVPLVLLALGVVRREDLVLYRLLQYLFPTQMVHYWFVTAYVTMYLFGPVLAAGAKALTRRQLQGVILCLLAFFSVSKTVLPVRLEMDNLGYDGLWFMCVFLVAAYIRLYGIPFFRDRRRSLVCYGLSCAGIYALTMAVRWVYLETGRLENYIQAAYSYNHLLVLLGAVSLFYAFLNWRMEGEGRLASLICGIGPCTFGVYLLHEQIELRFLWPGWLGAALTENPLLMVLRAAVSVLTVFALGILVDLCRKKLFDGVESLVRPRREGR